MPTFKYLLQMVFNYKSSRTLEGVIGMHCSEGFLCLYNA